MKVQRNTGVNGCMSELQETAVNQGGTAERFGPFGNRNVRRFFFGVIQKIRRNKDLYFP